MSVSDRTLDRLENYIQYVKEENLREILSMILEELRKQREQR